MYCRKRTPPGKIHKNGVPRQRSHPLFYVFYQGADFEFIDKSEIYHGEIKKRGSMNRKQAWNVITLFCIMIFGFTVATFLKPDAQHSESENRDLAQMPEVTLESVLSGEFESDYEEYLTDQFVGRDGWIGLKTGVERATGRRESKDIYFAEDEYLIEKHTGSFTADTAQQNVRVLGQFAKQYQDRFENGHMTFMVIPNAVDILRDKLPPFASPYDEEQYLKQLEEVLPEGMWFDAAAVLREHKEEEIYYRTDHHWTTLAAFYTYQAWAGQQGYAVPSQEDFEIETVTDSFEGTIQSNLAFAQGRIRLNCISTKRIFFIQWRKTEIRKLPTACMIIRL